WTVAPPTVPPNGNYLRNGNFEAGFSTRHDPYTGLWAGELEVAEGWDLWYDPVQKCPPTEPDCNPLSYNARPEYKGERGTSRVRSGQAAQKFFTTYATHTAGLYQKARVPPDSWVRFSIWVWVWSSSKDIPAHSFLPGAYGVSLGLDPTGGEDWHSERIQWSAPIIAYDRWLYLESVGHTESGEISVWVRGEQLYPVKHNDSYWDDAELVLLTGPPAPTATPTPTATPYPTLSPTPPGHEPAPCPFWRTVWRASFDGPGAADWGFDPGQGQIEPAGAALRLRNGERAGESFPLAWLERPLPLQGDLRFSFRLAFPASTAYGTTVGIGSQPYDGLRILAGAPSPYGIEDILRIHHHAADFSARLLGVTCWRGEPGDTAAHEVTLEVIDTTYILYLDGAKVGRGVSSWRPRSFYLGNPVIVWNWGFWTELDLQDVSVAECCNRLDIPLILHNRLYAEPTVPPAAKTHTTAATATPWP
ncbi:MAG: hypothetical protein H5T69_16005, partial [Chloroflexi bacterium]|nr:hypothetical protein [Chloroflexota bacterium]